MIARPLFLSSFAAYISLLTLAYSQLPQASVYDDETSTFLPYTSKRLADADGYTTRPENLEFSDYGGWKAHQVEGTGFFRVEQIDGRWWIIDPEGYRYIHKAVNSVQLFGSFTPDDVYELLPQFGMNGTGNWSDFEIQDSLLKQETPLAYCPKYSFVSSYKNTRADRLPIAVFDEAFVTYCEEKAEQNFARFKDDPQVLGYFIDNELSWTFSGGLESHLNVDDADDANYQAAISFLSGRGFTPAQFFALDDEDTPSDDDLADDYAAIMAERYLDVVCTAVRAVDPNHMILGPRLNKSWNRSKAFMEAAGRYLDIVAINHYHRWGSRSNELENIAKWTGRPLLISEFYAMEKIPDYEEKGAGWRVEDEASRALFYEHFVATHLEKPYLVGFHWFNFQDDFQDDDHTLPSARRGLIDIEGGSYTTLRDTMKYVNDRIYDYIDHVDSQPAPDVTLTSTADAYFQDLTNFGTGPELWAETGNARFDRSFYVRFDASAITGDVVSAKIQLFATSPDEKLSGEYTAELVVDNTWSETGINTPNKPPGSTVLATWSHGDDLEIEITDELHAALDGDGKLSFRVNSTLSNGAELLYGAREYPDAYAHPKLVVYYEQEQAATASHVISSENFEAGFGNWNSTGQDSILYTEGTYAHQGNNGALLRDNTSQSRLVSNVMNLEEYTSVTVDFWYYTVGLDVGHDLWLQISTDGGATYLTVKTWIAGTDFNNNEFTQGTVTVADTTLTANTLLRFKCDAQNNFDEIYLDEIKVTAHGSHNTESFSAWAAAKANLIQKNAFDDPDHDGTANLMEYVLNSDPMETDPDKLPSFERVGDSGVYSYTRRADSAQYTEQIVQYSADFEAWTDVHVTGPQDPMVTLNTDAEGRQEVKVILDENFEDQSRYVFRLKVIER